jgi:UDP-N-acetylmuramoyl-L-alanyl-D-glutamate--2,6-diaminopimelate ligase
MERTTPEAIDLQRTFREMLDAGDVACAMEISSHALELRRAEGIHCTASVFTNLSQDHLDFHGSMEDYFEAKAALFDPSRAAVAVVNADDPGGRALLERARLPTRPFSLQDAADLRVGHAASTFRWEGERVQLGLGGRFNVVNALAAATAARELGVVPADVARGLSSAPPVPGRFEPVEGGQPFAVVVDYAHTPAGLEQVLGAAAETAEGRVLVVFGCGGDRDRAKRPEMGEVATRLADLAVLTSDNPRSEDPMAIIDDVRAGVRRPEVLRVEPDRRAAIALALSEAGPGDVVVIAGKGHETEQRFAGHSVPFDDRVVARQELDQLRR